MVAERNKNYSVYTQAKIYHVCILNEVTGEVTTCLMVEFMSS